MNFKKVIFVLSFLAVCGFAFNAGAPSAKAVTASEIQSLIQHLQAQINALQKQLAETQGTTQAWCHTFNRNLKFGNSGSDVTALQTALQKEGLYTRTINGRFDQYTASAVVGFQEKYASEILAPWGLKYGTGYVGGTTRAKLNKLYGCGAVSLPSKEHYYVHITLPNGGEEWELGKSYTIRWEKEGVKNVNIELVSPESEEVCYLNPGIKTYYSPLPLPAYMGEYTVKLDKVHCYGGAGSWSWKKIEPGNRYKVVIRDADNPNIKDESDNYFSIIPSTGKFINVLTPTKYERVEAGSVYKITWRSNYSGNVNILLLDTCVGGTDYKVIAKNVKGDAWEYSFKMPPLSEICDLPGNNFKIWIGTYSPPEQVGKWGRWDSSVETVATSTLHGESEPFDVANKYIGLLSPNGGEKWVAGKSYYITWDAKKLDKVHILIENVTDPYSKTLSATIASDILASQGRYLWRIPENLPEFFGLSTDKFKGWSLTENKYKIVVVGGRDIFDSSDNYFTIVPATATTTSNPIYKTEYDGASLTGKLLRSDDGGKTWKVIMSEHRGKFVYAVYPKNPKIIYVGVTSGGAMTGLLGIKIVKSTNGGETWTVISKGVIRVVRKSYKFFDYYIEGTSEHVGLDGIESIWVNPSDSSIVEVVVRTSGGRKIHFFSLNSGENWTRTTPLDPNVPSTDSDNSPDYLRNSISYPITPEKYPDLFVKGITKGDWMGVGHQSICGAPPNPNVCKPTTNNYSTFYDRCINNQLYEGFVTTGGRITLYGRIDCPYGCKDGACLRSSSSSPLPSPSPTVSPTPTPTPTPVYTPYTTPTPSSTPTHAPAPSISLSLPTTTFRIGQVYTISWIASNIPSTAKKFYVELHWPNTSSIPFNIAIVDVDHSVAIKRYTYSWYVSPGYDVCNGMHIRVRTDDGNVSTETSSGVKIFKPVSSPSPSPSLSPSPAPTSSATSSTLLKALENNLAAVAQGISSLLNKLQDIAR